MRAWSALLVGLAATCSFSERLLLVPIDNRPASGQFAQMIAEMADVSVIQPPDELLGQFTQPGDPDRILDWLRLQDLRGVDAVVISADMMAFGGLIASRNPGVDYATALFRIKALGGLKAQHPGLKVYAYSATMRLTPTATRANAPWRLALGRYAELRERYRARRDAATLKSLRNLEAIIPADEVRRYDWVRRRNHELQQAMLRLVKYGSFDYVVMGQDDAQPSGPHISETVRLRKTVTDLGIQDRVCFVEGIDQQPNVLLSRALLKERNWTPRVRVAYSDPEGRKKVALYESRTIEASLRDQLIASGARPAALHGEYDYTLYLNTPNPDSLPFQNFLGQMVSDLDADRPISLADINLGADGTSDPELVDFLWGEDRITQLISYAGWNTAGNTMGTAIPAANVYLLAKRANVDPYRREVAQRTFLLHRFVNDYQYHRFTRPGAYRLIDSSDRASREETYGEALEDLNSFVRQDLGRRLEDTFREQFLGRRIETKDAEYALSGLDHVRIYLPWPRAYEVRLEFQLTTRTVASHLDGIATAQAGPKAHQP